MKTKTKERKRPLSELGKLAVAAAAQGLRPLSQLGLQKGN